MRELLGERLDVKFGEVIQHSGRYEHLKRVRYRGDGVRFVRPSDAHTNNYLAALDIVGCRPCAVPYLQKGDDDAGAEPLPPEMASAYRTAMGIALFIAADRWDLHREVQRCTRILAAPSSHDWRRAVRIGKYLQGPRLVGTLLRLDPGLARASGKVLLDMFGDSDHAGCVATRRRVSCGVFMLNVKGVGVFGVAAGPADTSREVRGRSPLNVPIAPFGHEMPVDPGRGSHLEHGLAQGRGQGQPRRPRHQGVAHSGGVIAASRLMRSGIAACVGDCV